MKMENRTFIKANDHQRAMRSIDSASLNIKMPGIVNQLRDKMATAMKWPPERIFKSVATMYSRFLLKELSHEKQIQTTITDPKDSNNTERKLSVFSTISVTQFRRQVGDAASWKVPRGIGRFTVIEITYQPQAVVDYSI